MDIHEATHLREKYIERMARKLMLGLECHGAAREELEEARTLVYQWREEKRAQRASGAAV